MPGYPSIFDSGAEWSMNAVAQMFPCKWVRELAEENRNKFHAFSEFQNTKRKCSGPEIPSSLFSGNPDRDIWRAEGLGAHLADLSGRPAASVLLREWPARLGVPPSFLLPLHTGGGLALAQAAVLAHRSAIKNQQVGEFLAAFQSTIEQQCNPGLRPAVFEALGLVLQTMHPDLLDPIATHLQEHDPAGHRLLWHGVGRGHYFDPFQMMLPPNLRGRAFLSATNEAALNRLAGFAWAVTMVNMRSPSTAAKVLGNLPLADQRSVAAIADGVSAAGLLWLGMTDNRSALDRLERALRVPDVFSNQSASTKIREAITTRSETHPTSEDLGALFSFDSAE